MKAYDYLNTVVETVAGIGHRDNRDFQQAFSTAATALRSATPEAELLPKARCYTRSQIQHRRV
jgi:hypothetical protein